MHACRKVTHGHDDLSIFFIWHYKPLFCNNNLDSPCKINTILVMVVFILCSKTFKFQADSYLMDEGEQNQQHDSAALCRRRASIETNFIHLLWPKKNAFATSHILSGKKYQGSDGIWPANAQTPPKWPWNANTTFPHSGNPVTVLTLWNRSHQWRRLSQWWWDMWAW